MIRYFNNHPSIEIGFVLSNKSDASVLNSAKELGIEVLYHSNQEVANGDFLVQICQAHRIDWVMLAGYLRLIPAELIQHFENRIINLHPSLLPNYGGKGMYGMRVHQAVKDAKETESGITIHYVNEHYDEGAIILQEKTAIVIDDSATEIAKKVQQLEHHFLPITIDNLLQ